jgi:Predicted pPIWI-associating nuclease
MKNAVTDAIQLALDKGFETNLFEAAIRNLEDKTNPLRFNNFAYAVPPVPM